MKALFRVLFIFSTLSLFGLDKSEILELAANQTRNHEPVKALRTLLDGIKEYPEEGEFYLKVGDFYRDSGNLELAAEVLEKGYKAAPLPELMYRLSSIYGRMNEDEKAASALENLLAADPGAADYRQDLAWEYVKIYQPEKAEKVLLEGLDINGNNNSFLLTLGTVYYYLYDYEKSKSYYLQTAAHIASGNITKSIAYYNISLLEKAYFNWQEAFSYANKSIIAHKDRASGYRSRGDLELNRLNYRQAIEDYLTAVERDDSPLSYLGLAGAYYGAGRFDDAVQALKNVENFPDKSWIIRFGIDKWQLRQSIYRYYSDIYGAKAKALSLEYKPGLLLKIGSGLERAWLNIKSWYSGLAGSIISWKIGRKTYSQGNELDGLSYYLECFAGVGPGRVKYEGLYANSLIKHIPEAGAYAGVIKAGDDPDKLIKLLPEFNNEFDKSLKSSMLKDIINNIVKNERDGFLKETYRLDPPAFIRNGWKLPLTATPECMALLGKELCKFYGIKDIGPDTAYFLSMDNGDISLNGPSGQILKKISAQSLLDGRGFIEFLYSI